MIGKMYVALNNPDLQGTYNWTESEKRNFLESVGQDPDRNAINFEEFRRMLS